MTADLHVYHSRPILRGCVKVYFKVISEFYAISYIIATTEHAITQRTSFATNTADRRCFRQARQHIPGSFRQLSII